MSHIFEVTDEEYQAITEAAKARGQAADAFFHSWVRAMQQAIAGEATDPDRKGL